jgi:hypothetical protein
MLVPALKALVESTTRGDRRRLRFPDQRMSFAAGDEQVEQDRAASVLVHARPEKNPQE